MEALAEKIARWFGTNLGLDEDQREVIAYAVITLFLLIIPLFFLLILCWFFGVLYEGLTVALTAAILRSVTGGAHLSSPWRCILISTAVPVLFALGAKAAGPYISAGTMTGILILALSWGLYTIHLYAPAEVKEKPVKPEKRGVYRRMSFLYTVIWAVFAGYLIYKDAGNLFLATTLGFIWQMITLTPIGFYIYRRLS